MTLREVIASNGARVEIIPVANKAHYDMYHVRLVSGYWPVGLELIKLCMGGDAPFGGCVKDKFGMAATVVVFLD